MRRILAIALLIAFGSPLVLPLLASTSDSQSSLPACCRRNGAHHCSMRVMMNVGSDPAFTTPPCSNYPSPATPLRLNVAAFTPLETASIALLRTSSPLASHQLLAHGFSLLANPTRGPPAPLA